MEKESVFLHRGDAVRHPGSAFGLLLVAEKSLATAVASSLWVRRTVGTGSDSLSASRSKRPESDGDRLELGHLKAVRFRCRQVGCARIDLHAVDISS